MTISEQQIYPRTGDEETVYLKNVIKNPRILVGEYTMYNDFVNDPAEFGTKQCIILSDQP